MNTRKAMLDGASQYVGKTLDALTIAAMKADCIVRVTHRDGRDFMGTCDFRPNRINVHIAGGIVTSIEGIG